MKTTALNAAVYNGNFDMVAFLIMNGANTNYDEEVKKFIKSC